MFDNVPLINPDRDESWSQFIAREDVKHYFSSTPEFKFPLDKSYDLWCVAWEQAWETGFQTGYQNSNDKLDNLEQAYILLSTHHSECMLEIVELHKRLKEAQENSGWIDRTWNRIKTVFVRNHD